MTHARMPMRRAPGARPATITSSMIGEGDVAINLAERPAPTVSVHRAAAQ
ncbi:hypothetical protein B1M_17440 [Burkholderia sp. TJI49]|nr:hypothetical protein B1M_17440 [Burkholderia sp. TJI49]